MFNSTVSLSATLKGDGWSTTRHDRFNRFKYSSRPRFDPRTVQPVAFLCTQYDVPPHKNVLIKISETLEYTINKCCVYINICYIAVSADTSGRAV